MKMKHGHYTGIISILAAACLSLAADNGSAAEPAVKGLGDLKTGRILILGNSITRHGPNPNVGWTNNCGMAASSLEKDYSHLLLASIADLSGTKPESMIGNIADFERNYATFDLAAKLKDHIAFKPDIVVIAIGENVEAPASEKAKADFKAAFTKLLTLLSSDGHPVIFVRSSFWADKTKDSILRQVCADFNGVFVDISALGNDESNYARSERKFSNDGVAKHPGDKGMKAIADSILTAMKNFAAKPPAGK